MTTELTEGRYTFNTSDFDFDPETATMSCEASELYEDFDSILCIKSVFTDRVEVFELIHVMRDADGDVTCWVYASRDKDLKCKRVRIWND